MWGTCPTMFDPTQAPPGKHTAFMWEKLPYAVQGSAANWDSLKDRHGQAMLRLWSQYAPNLRGKTVIDAFTRSPLDTERSLPNMQGGDLLVGIICQQPSGLQPAFSGSGPLPHADRRAFTCAVAQPIRAETSPAYADIIPPARWRRTSACHSGGIRRKLKAPSKPYPADFGLNMAWET